MTTEQKQLVEDAARLLGLEVVDWRGSTPVATDNQGLLSGFNPYDPERGDLMKVAMAAELWIDFQFERVFYDYSSDEESFGFDKNDCQSLALAILRAASAVMKARNGNENH